MTVHSLPDFSGFIWFLLVLVFGGFVFLFWRVIQGSTNDISSLKDAIMVLQKELVETREAFKIFPLVYRTKEEANKDWKELTKTLAEIQTEIRNLLNNQAIGNQQIWDKLNRTVESFFFLAKMIIDRQQALENKIYCDDKDSLIKAKQESTEILTQLDKMRSEHSGNHANKS